MPAQTINLMPVFREVFCLQIEMMSSINPKQIVKHANVPIIVSKYFSR